MSEPLIEGQSEIVRIKQHIVEGQLGRRAGDGQFVLGGVQIGAETVNVPIEDILAQYVGEEIRIVVVSLRDAARLVALAHEVSSGDG